MNGHIKILKPRLRCIRRRQDESRRTPEAAVGESVVRRQAGGESLEARLRLLFEAGSNLALVQIQELLGDRTRTNEPGTVGGHNWTNRLPLPIEAIEEHEQLGEFLGRVRVHLEATKRA